MPERRRLGFSMPAAVQRTVRFVVALGLVIYEAVIHDGEPRPLLLGLYLTMMGLPVAEGADALRRAAMRRLQPPEGGDQ